MGASSLARCRPIRNPVLRFTLGGTIDASLWDGYRSAGQLIRRLRCGGSRDSSVYQKPFCRARGFSPLSMSPCIRLILFSSSTRQRGEFAGNIGFRRSSLTTSPSVLTNQGAR